MLAQTLGFENKENAVLSVRREACQQVSYCVSKQEKAKRARKTSVMNTRTHRI
jgi:hypothetical protein